MLLLATVAILLAGPADAYGNSALQYVGSFKGPARSDDRQTAILMARNGTVTAVNRSGRVHRRALPPGCTPRPLRYPRLALACTVDGAERPAVLNVATGAVQTPPPATMGNRDAQASDSFFTAGRYWLEGIRTHADGSSIPVVRHRYTPAQFRIWTGEADLDSPPTSSTRCPRHPSTSAAPTSPPRRTGCGCSTADAARSSRAARKGATRSPAVPATASTSSTAGLDKWRWTRPGSCGHGGSQQVAASASRSVLIGNAVFANLFVDGTWRVFRGELA